MQRLFSIVILFVVCLVCNAQKTKKVSASYTYYAPETMSVEEAKRTALERAKIQAIADEFGSVVSQSTSTIVSNYNGESESQFFSTGGSDIKGEWIETIGQPSFDIKYENGGLTIRCAVKGIVRELLTSNINFDAKILCNGTDDKFEQTTFKEGDDVYLWFQSPHNGYLLAFWVDYTEDVVYRILPYQSSSKSFTHIDKDSQYVFFSKECSNANERSSVDEFTINCNAPIERNELYLIFSDSKFNIPNMDGARTGLKWMSLKNFNRWLPEIRRRDVTVKQFSITITKQ